jgi:DNA-binding MarR family transcriptional regulator
MAYHNRIRVHQATLLRESILRDGLGLHEHRVLEVLAAKMAKRTGPRPLTIIDTCYPSISTIAEYSILSKSAVNRAITKLIGHGYITKSKIPGYKLRKNNPSDRFDGNRYHLVPEIWDAAFTPKDKVKAAAGDESTSIPPAISAAKQAKEQAVLDELDIEPAQKDSKPSSAEDKYAQTEAIIALLKEDFGDHPTFQRPDATRIMTGCVRACIDIVGTEYSCVSAFEWIFDDEKTRIATAKSKLLGGFIRGAFTNWFAEFKAGADELGQQFVDEQCQSDDVEFYVVFNRSDLHHVKPTSNWLKKHLGFHLRDIVEDDGTAAGTEEEAQVMMFRISDEYRAARRAVRDQEVESVDDAGRDEDQVLSSVDGGDETDFADQDEDMRNDPKSVVEIGRVNPGSREITTTQAAYELSWQILVGLGHKRIKADAHRVLAQKLFPLIREHGYKDVKRTIDWMIGVNAYWLTQLPWGHNGDKCPIATFVARYPEFHPEAYAYYVTEQNAIKRENPGYNPDIDDPTTGIGKLAAAMTNQRF